MVSLNSKKAGAWLKLANGLMVLVVLNQLLSSYFFRLDLTEEKRYSIKPQTIELLQGLEDEVFIEVYLEGELNPGFARVRNYTREMLEEFRVYSGNKITYVFTNPEAAQSEKARNEFMNSLVQKGINPLNVIDNQNGQRTQKIVFPGALISYGGLETSVMFVKSGSGQGSRQEILNQAVEDVEYELANAIEKLAATARKRIGFVTGHGELDSVQRASLTRALKEKFWVKSISLNTQVPIGFDALVVAKPIQPFSDREVFYLDQYVMQGGRVLFLLDKLDASMEKAMDENYLALPLNTGLDELLFKYGIRINNDLVQDLSSLKYPVVTGQTTDGRPEITPIEWPFFPLVNTYSNHLATRHLDAVAFKFASTIDTIAAKGVTKTPLVFTSPYSRVLGAPVTVNVANLKRDLNPAAFQAGPKALGFLLEGNFTSVYQNRILPENADKSNFIETSAQTKLVVVSDGDFARNEVNARTGQSSPLGYDPVFNVTFANEDFLMNVLNYLTNESGIINTRAKEILIRPLDKNKVAQSKTFYQVVNLVVPVALVILLSVLLNFLRAKRFAVKSNA